jgi:hypothetical protein
MDRAQNPKSVRGHSPETFSEYKNHRTHVAFLQNYGHDAEVMSCTLIFHLILMMKYIH